MRNTAISVATAKSEGDRKRERLQSLVIKVLVFKRCQIVHPSTLTKNEGKEKGDERQRAPSPTKKQQTPNSKDGTQAGKKHVKKKGHPPFCVFLRRTGHCRSGTKCSLAHHKDDQSLSRQHQPEGDNFKDSNMIAQDKSRRESLSKFPKWRTSMLRVTLKRHEAKGPIQTVRWSAYDMKKRMYIVDSGDSLHMMGESSLLFRRKRTHMSDQQLLEYPHANNGNYLNVKLVEDRAIVR